LQNKSPVKIVIAGIWQWGQYEEAFAAALFELGHEVTPFRTSGFFNGFLGKQQAAIPLVGFAFLRLNRELLKLVKREKPDILLLWQCIHLLPATIKSINSMGVKTVSYNNDDPFGPKAHGNVPWHHHLVWFWYLRSLKHCQYNFFYRQVNVVEAQAVGAHHAAVLKPYFIPWKDHPAVLSEDEIKRFGCDVVFVGHYEPDERVKHLRALVKTGLSVKLFGGSYWTPEVLGDLYSYFAPIVPAQGENYAKALCGAKVCLVFLSKLNRDSYTRRCFEIPACGRVMLAERTAALLEMFVEDKEACFFSNSEELVSKAKWLVENPEIAAQIAQAGLKRVWVDGHDVKSRAAEFLFDLHRDNG
jgi:spore maturation protein CgeB